MKRVFAFVLIFLFAINAVLAQKTIRMEKEGGIYKISCKVNGAPMKMYFDTGASTVSISRATAIYLLENDLISVQDFRGKTKTATADGTISDNMVINIQDIEIAGIHLRDVKATVSYSLNAPLLLGQTAIQRLGKISLNGNILTIHTNTPATTLQNKERDELDLKLRHLVKNASDDYEIDYEVLGIIEKIELNGQLNEFELFEKVTSLMNLSKYDDVVPAAQTWIDRYASNTDSIRWKMRVLLMAAEANSRIGNVEKSLEYLRRCQYYWEKSEETELFMKVKMSVIGNCCYYKNNGFNDAILATKELINYIFKTKHVTLSGINRNQYPNWEHAGLMHILSVFYYSHYDWLLKNNNYINNNFVNLMNVVTILAAKVGDKESVDACLSNNFDYKKVLTYSELEMTGLLVY